MTKMNVEEFAAASGIDPNTLSKADGTDGVEFDFVADVASEALVKYQFAVGEILDPVKGAIECLMASYPMGCGIIIDDSEVSANAEEKAQAERLRNGRLFVRVTIMSNGQNPPEIGWDMP